MKFKLSLIVCYEFLSTLLYCSSPMCTIIWSEIGMYVLLFDLVRVKIKKSIAVYRFSPLFCCYNERIYLWTVIIAMVYRYRLHKLIKRVYLMRNCEIRIVFHPLEPQLIVVYDSWIFEHPASLSRLSDCGFSLGLKKCFKLELFCATDHKRFFPIFWSVSAACV